MLFQKKVHQIASAQYPQMPRYPKFSGRHYDEEDMEKWRQSRENLFEHTSKDFPEVNDFAIISGPSFLIDNDGRNIIFSPVSLFMALVLCANITEGNTRQQILRSLGANDIDTLTDRASSIWKSCYINDGCSKSIIATSLWLNDGILPQKHLLELLAKKYYVSSFSGKMGSTELTRAICKWVNVQTDGLLEKAVSRVNTKSTDAMILATTLNFCAKWSVQFQKESNTKSVFHAKSGDKKCTFMNRKLLRNYYYFDKFAYIDLDFDYNGTIRLVLPDEGISPEEVINNKSFLKNILCDKNSISTDNAQRAQISLSLPKFDISSDKDVGLAIKKLGIHDIFTKNADFSTLTKNSDGLSVSSISQSVRVKIDEEGCKAVAFTIMKAHGCMPPDPDGHVDMFFERPFIFVIFSETGFPLFIGIVNDI